MPKKMKFSNWLFIWGLTFFLLSPGLDAQYFGRNKVQYQKFDFRIIKTKHFDVYYYPEFKLVAEDSARMALLTGKVIEHETGIANVADPLAGSYYVEALTRDMEKAIEFYRDVLGMKLSHRVKAPWNKGEFAVLKSKEGGPNLELNWYADDCASSFTNSRRS